MKIIPLVLASGLALLSAGSGVAAPPPAQPKLVVVVSVDQFSEDLYQRYRPTYAAGLKRLSGGEVFVGYHSHGATETCPGHSTLLTGMHPSHTGIVANNWFDRKSGSNLYCVTKAGDADPLAKSSELLKVDTLGDWMRTARPGSRTWSVSGKDRAAIMMAGHHPTGVFWWDDGLGFDTSIYAGPADAKTVAPAAAFNKALFAAWSKTPPALWPEASDRCKAMEKPIKMGATTYSGRIPPDTATTAETGDGWLTSATFAGELRASPLIDQTTLAFAEKLIDEEQLGRGPATDILAISLSAVDYVGHRYGPGGPEMCVEMAAVDNGIGELMARIDALNIPYVVVLSADHGSIDVPERLGPPAQRLDPARTLRDLTAFVRKTYDLAYDPFQGDDPRQLILSLAPNDDRRRAEITGGVIDWLKQRPEIAQAFTAEEVASAVPPKGKAPAALTLAERLNESYDKERSGDIIVVWAERASLGVPTSPYDTVAGHGSPWDYDRRVPILVWWPGAEPKDEPVAIETVDIAPTLAPMVGVKPPAELDGRCVELGQGCKP